MQKPRARSPKKLLVASIGVATVSYVVFACKQPNSVDNVPVANLVAAPAYDAGMQADARDSATRTIDETGATEHQAPRVDNFPVANLVAAPPPHRADAGRSSK